MAPKAERVSRLDAAGSAHSRIARIAGWVIVLAAMAVYSTSWSGVFVGDDLEAIVKNGTLRRLWPIGPALVPPIAQGQTVGGRPALNLSLAINYAVSGLRVWSYHAVNLGIHVLAALILFGILRRTLRRRSAGESAASIVFAGTVSLWWAVHPLQTEAVTYIVQRAESMMGLCYLLTLYCFIRYAEEGQGAGPACGGSRRASFAAVWAALSVLACLTGMATKEVMASAPVMVLLYDRVFVSGSFREAWRRHRGVLVSLACTWILLGWLVTGTGGNRGGSMWAGAGATYWKYALTQFPAIVHYLRLVAWPHPLIFDYGAEWVERPARVIPAAVLVAALVAGTIGAWWRGCARDAAGGAALSFAFLGIWFFAILSPTSLVPGDRQTMSEHRMYLALIPVMILAAAGLQWAVERLGRRRAPVVRLRLFAASAVLLATGWGLRTVWRNRVYHSDLALWSDTAAYRPKNPYAHNNLGQALAIRGRVGEAMAQFKRALQLAPGLFAAHANLANTLVSMGKPAEAVPEYETAIRLHPGNPDWELDLGVALARAGRPAEAASHAEAALRLKPDFPEAENNLGNAWTQLGRLPAAIDRYGQALRLRPNYPEAEYGLGNALANSGRLSEGIAHYQEALRLRPDYPEASANLGLALASSGRLPEAIGELTEAVRLHPRDTEAHAYLGFALARSGRLVEAVDAYREALRLDPDAAAIHYQLGSALRALGRTAEAADEFAAADRPSSQSAGRPDRRP